MDGMLVRLGRVSLGWGVRELAAESGVAASTIMRIEKGGGAQTRTIAKLRQTLEACGVRFVPADDSGSAGVRLPPKSGTSRKRSAR